MALFLTVPAFTYEVTTSHLVYYSLILLTLTAYCNAACRNPGFVTKNISTAPSVNISNVPEKNELSINGTKSLRIDSLSHFTESSMAPNSPTAKQFGNTNINDTLTEECANSSRKHDDPKSEVELMRPNEDNSDSSDSDESGS